MTKKELTAYVAEKTGMTRKDSEVAVNAVFSGITEALKTEGKVQISGFGAFEVKERAARAGVNPATHAPIQIPATRVPGFKAGKALKDAVK